MATSYIGHLREFNQSVSDWTIYKQQLRQFFVANKVETEDVKRAILLNCCSESSYQLLCSLCIPAKPKTKTFDELVAFFDSHFTPAKLVFPERLKFYSATKNKDETIQEWAAHVKQLAAKCEFKDSELSTVLRDKFIMGLERGPIMDKLFEEKESTLNFNKAVEIASNKEATSKSGETRVKMEPSEVYRFGFRNTGGKTKKSGAKSASVHRQNQHHGQHHSTRPSEYSSSAPSSGV